MSSNHNTDVAAMHSSKSQEIEKTEREGQDNMDNAVLESVTANP